LRILIVATQVQLPGRHGGTTHVSELLRNLQRYGEVMVLAQLGSHAPNVVGVSLPVRANGNLGKALSYAYLPKALLAARRFAPDVIYERGSSFGLGALLSHALGAPMLCMVLDEHFSRRSLLRASKVISTTESTVPAEFRHKFVKVSWGANAERFNPSVAPVNTSQLPRFDGTTLGYVGSFKRWHGLSDLVKAASQFKDRPVRWLMVGDGPERPHIERFAREAGVLERFVFSGAVDYDDVPHWIAAMDVCLAPFHPNLHGAPNETFVLDPLKVFEYLAMAKPTITIDSGNIRALLSDQQHARLVTAGDEQALFTAIDQVLSDPDSARQMAERGRQLVLQRYTWAAHAAHLHDLFSEMSAA
jgi:glycosyltransferase involved in cell wall biosynthesis